MALLFTVLTMAGTWVLWWGIIAANSVGALAYGTPLMMVLYLVGVCMPAIVAIALLIKKQHMGPKAVLSLIFTFRHPLWLYALVALSVWGQGAVFLLAGKAVIAAPLYLAVLTIPPMVIGGGLQEIGWRLILGPSLQEKLPFALATFIVGVVWALWHLPLFFMPGTLQ